MRLALAWSKIAPPRHCAGMCLPRRICAARVAFVGGRARVAVWDGLGANGYAGANDDPYENLRSF